MQKHKFGACTKVVFFMHQMCFWCSSTLLVFLHVHHLLENPDGTDL